MKERKANIRLGCYCLNGDKNNMFKLIFVVIFVLDLQIKNYFQFHFVQYKEFLEFLELFDLSLEMYSTFFFLSFRKKMQSYLLLGLNFCFFV